MPNPPTSSGAADQTPTSTQAPNAQERICGVCQTRLQHRLIGLLEHCTHDFCARCLATWMATRNTCPLCRQVSVRCLLWPSFVDDPTTKRRLFNGQYYYCQQSKLNYIHLGSREELDMVVAAYAASEWTSYVDIRAQMDRILRVPNELTEGTAALRTLQEWVHQLVADFVSARVRESVVRTNAPN